MKWLSFSLGVHVAVFQAETFLILAHGREWVGRGCTGECIYMCSDSQAALWALKALRAMSRLV